MTMTYVEPAWVGEMKRTREMLERQEKKPPMVASRARAEDIRAVPEIMGLAIKRQVTKRVRRTKRGTH